MHRQVIGEVMAKRAEEARSSGLGTVRTIIGMNGQRGWNAQCEMRLLQLRKIKKDRANEEREKRAEEKLKQDERKKEGEGNAYAANSDSAATGR